MVDFKQRIFFNNRLVIFLTYKKRVYIKVPDPGNREVWGGDPGTMPLSDAWKEKLGLSLKERVWHDFGVFFMFYNLALRRAGPFTLSERI